MTDQNETVTAVPARRSNKPLAFGLLALTVAMIGLSFAAVPLYRIFCQATGYGGTTQRADAPSGVASDRVISIRFDGNVSSEMDWGFRPAQNQLDVKIGENKLAFFKAVNHSDKTVTGTATFNVTPEIAGSYFNKVECFCFTEQTLAAGQEADMPVSFFIDPAILKDPDAQRIQEITLSYTFFKVEKSNDAAAVAPDKGAASRQFEKGNQPG